MTAIDEMLHANAQFAGGFNPEPTPPTPRLALILCMDARIEPFRAMGIRQGHAHVIRNAGGRLADAVRSLVVSQRLIGTEEVAIVHHTQCGMQRATDDEIHSTLRQQGHLTEHIAFLTFADLEESVRYDLADYRNQPLLRQDIPVRGFVYEVETGRLREVFED